MEIKRCYETIIGATVNVNQLANGVWLITGGTKTENADGSCTFTANASGQQVYNGNIRGMQTHKYYAVALYKTNSATSDVGLRVFSTNYYGTATTNWQIRNTICQCYYTGGVSIGIVDSRASGWDIITVKYFMFIDLTAMFGSTIADYAYTLEQATAGSGIAWLRSYGFLTDDYVPYNTGTIESVEATAKVVRDENGENAVTYPLGSDVLRGIFKLDASNNLYADGDRKESDGTVTRKYGVVDLGTLDWTYAESNKRIFARLNNSISLTYGMPNAISNIPYNMVSAQSLSANDVGWTIYEGTMYVRNTSASEADLRALVIGKTAVYELATPTTEQSTPFTSPQIVYPDGTEEFVTENGVPVGHETKYQL